MAFSLGFTPDQTLHYKNDGQTLIDKNSQEILCLFTLIYLTMNFLPFVVFMALPLKKTYPLSRVSKIKNGLSKQIKMQVMNFLMYLHYMKNVCLMTLSKWQQ